MESFLGLPFQIQSILVAGYLGHRANMIARKNSSSLQAQFFETLAFGLIGFFIASFFVNIVSALQNRPYLFTAIMVPAAIIIGLVWQALVQSLFYKILRRLNLIAVDPYDTVLETIQNDCKHLKWGSVSVTLTADLFKTAQHQSTQTELQLVGWRCPLGEPLVHPVSCTVISPSPRTQNDEPLAGSLDKYHRTNVFIPQ